MSLILTLFECFRSIRANGTSKGQTRGNTVAILHEQAVDRVKKALVGELRVRLDKPVYEPPKSSTLTINPWD
jgi:hypothetical protein